MKFLIVSERVYGLPPSEDPSALFKASKEYLNALLADGSLECLYITPDGGGMAIANVGSHEELWDMMDVYPAASFIKQKFYPLLDHNHFYDKLIEKYQ